MCLKVCHVSSDFDGAKLKFDLIYDKYQPAQGLSKGGTRRRTCAIELPPREQSPTQVAWGTYLLLRDLLT
ncbi:hypothetical protein PSHT_07447 [Puccinia striiformis]|uniref:Uncharacterized protein n=1 Tax=Puccinia striiformis TaxID=27350 RepID=A0A2S4VY78_9BASI|nr:hypothetical protein PSHT_07447 [Puccinia striiformis]